MPPRREEGVGCTELQRVRVDKARPHFFQRLRRAFRPKKFSGAMATRGRRGADPNRAFGAAAQEPSETVKDGITRPTSLMAGLIAFEDSLYPATRALADEEVAPDDREAERKRAEIVISQAAERQKLADDFLNGIAATTNSIVEKHRTVRRINPIGKAPSVSSVKSATLRCAEAWFALSKFAADEHRLKAQRKSLESELKAAEGKASKKNIQRKLDAAAKKHEKAKGRLEAALKGQTGFDSVKTRKEKARGAASRQQGGSSVHTGASSGSDHVADEDVATLIEGVAEGALFMHGQGRSSELPLFKPDHEKVPNRTWVLNWMLNCIFTGTADCTMFINYMFLNHSESVEGKDKGGVRTTPFEAGSAEDVAVVKNVAEFLESFRHVAKAQELAEEAHLEGGFVLADPHGFRFRVKSLASDFSEEAIDETISARVAHFEKGRAERGEKKAGKGELAEFRALEMKRILRNFAVRACIMVIESFHDAVIQIHHGDVSKVMAEILDARQNACFRLMGVDALNKEEADLKADEVVAPKQGDTELPLVSRDVIEALVQFARVQHIFAVSPSEMLAAVKTKLVANIEASFPTAQHLALQASRSARVLPKLAFPSMVSSAAEGDGAVGGGVDFGAALSPESGKERGASTQANVDATKVIQEAISKTAKIQRALDKSISLRRSAGDKSVRRAPRGVVEAEQNSVRKLQSTAKEAGMKVKEVGTGTGSRRTGAGSRSPESVGARVGARTRSRKGAKDGKERREEKEEEEKEEEEGEEREGGEEEEEERDVVDFEGGSPEGSDPGVRETMLLPLTSAAKGFSKSKRLQRAAGFMSSFVQSERSVCRTKWKGKVPIEWRHLAILFHMLNKLQESMGDASLNERFIVERVDKAREDVDACEENAGKLGSKLTTPQTEPQRADHVAAIRTMLSLSVAQHLSVTLSEETLKKAFFENLGRFVEEKGSATRGVSEDLLKPLGAATEASRGRGASGGAKREEEKDSEEGGGDFDTEEVGAAGPHVGLRPGRGRTQRKTAAKAKAEAAAAAEAAAEAEAKKKREAEARRKAAAAKRKKEAEKKAAAAKKKKAAAAKRKKEAEKKKKEEEEKAAAAARVEAEEEKEEKDATPPPLPSNPPPPVPRRGARIRRPSAKVIQNAQTS